MRTDSDTRPTGGLRRYYDWHALLPRLGMCKPAAAGGFDLPYDVDDLLTAIAPRPTLLVTPMRDRDASFTEVLATIAEVNSSWPSGALTHLAPSSGHEAYSEFGVKQIEQLSNWLFEQTRHFDKTSRIYYV